RAYYNIEGHLVFYSSDLRAWVYYWSPPTALVYVWNGAYPARQFVWADGCYGAGWYWGAPRPDGFHGYADASYRPVFPSNPGRPAVRPAPQPGGRPVPVPTSRPSRP